MPLGALGQAPVVLAQQPQANAMAVPVAGAIQLTFSQAMSAQAASSTGLRITSAWRGIIPGTYTGAGTPELRFTPDQALLPGEPVQVTVTASATSQAGIMPTAPFTYQFRAATSGGNGQFLDEEIATGTTPTRIATGDINKDGNLDFVVDQDANGGILVYLGDGQGGFLPPPAPIPNGVGGISASVSQLALADINHDGNLDLCRVGNYLRGELLVWTGDGTGRFTASGGASSYNNLGGLAVGDLNGDGFADLLTTDGRANKVLIRLGTSKGSLTAAPDVPMTSYPDDVAVADVNGDGKLDMLVLNYTSGGSSVSVRVGDGAGNFTTPPAAEVPLTVGSAEIAIGDINGDGNADFVASNGLTNTVLVRLGDGTGRFRAAPEVSVGQKPLTIALADLNRDGKLDFVTTLNGDNSTTVSVRLGDGQGGFQAGAQPEVLVGIKPAGLALADVNNDGQADLLVGNTGSPTKVISSNFGTVSVRLGNGAGGFVRIPAPRVASVASGGQVQRLAVGDVNNDGRPDLLPVYYGNGASVGGVSVRLGKGKGAFESPAAPLLAEVPGAELFPEVIAVGDVNNDGKLDFVTQASSQPATYLGDGNGGFSALPYAQNSYVQRKFTSMLLADVTGDGYLDLLVTHALGTTVILGDGTGRFSKAPASSVPNGRGSNPFALRVGDMNGDGKLDMLVGTFSSPDSRGTVAVRLGDGTGNFTPPPSPIAPELVLGHNYLQDLDIADVNGDGNLDFVAVTGPPNGGYENHASIWLGTGKGGFVPAAVAELLLPTEHPTNVALGDMNGDGNMDLVVSTSLYSSRVVIRLGDGQGRFTAPATRGVIVAGDGIRSLYLTDVDADGDLDILLANSKDNSVSVRLNGGYIGSVLPTRVATKAPIAESLGIYPNPVRTTATVVGAPSGEPLLLLDLLGREVRRYAPASTLDMTGVKPGLYVVRCGMRSTHLVVD
jgi:hypothetical protein